MGVTDLALNCGSVPAMDVVCTAVVGSARTGRVLDAGSDREDRSSDVCYVGDTQWSFTEKDYDSILHTRHLCRNVSHRNLNLNIVSLARLCVSLYRSVARVVSDKTGSPFNPGEKWDRALHGASRPEKGLVVRGREVGLTGTSATAISSGTAGRRLWRSWMSPATLAIQQWQKLLGMFGLLGSPSAVPRQCLLSQSPLAKLCRLGQEQRAHPVPLVQPSQCLLMKLGLLESQSRAPRQIPISQGLQAKRGLLGPEHMT